MGDLESLAEATSAAERAISRYYEHVMFKALLPDQAHELARLAVSAAAPILIAAGRAQAAADIRAERDRWDRLGYSDEGAWLAAVRAAEGGGEADHKKALDRVWWLHRCDPNDPKRAWLSEVPGVPRPVACPGCGGSGWGWFEARPVGDVVG